MSKKWPAKEIVSRHTQTMNPHSCPFYRRRMCKISPMELQRDHAPAGAPPGMKLLRDAALFSFCVAVLDEIYTVGPQKYLAVLTCANGPGNVRYPRKRRAKEYHMRPSSWRPPVEPSSLEQVIIARIKRAKLFVFLRHHRHELFDDAFQEELAALYAPSLRGQPPIPPAQLALATIVQAYTGVSYAEVIEATLIDRRWQLVLDCLDIEQAPFSKGTFVAFRKRLI